MAAPDSTDENGLVSLRDMIDFISHVADCYPQITKHLPDHLIEILSLHHAKLEPELRDKVVGSLVLLRNKDLIDSTTSVKTSLVLRSNGGLTAHTGC